MFGAAVRQRYRRLVKDLYALAELVRHRFAVAEIVGIESAIEGIATRSAAAWDIGRVMIDRTRQGARDNLGSLRKRLTSGHSVDVARLSVDVSRNNSRQLDSGIREIGENLSRVRDDIRTPYATRMDSLKGLLRKDWDE